jgi:glutaredoxin 3
MYWSANLINPNFITHQENQMTQVTMLTSPTCGYCHAARNLLQQQGITYEEVDLIKDDKQVQQLLIQSGQRTVPQIFT